MFPPAQAWRRSRAELALTGFLVLLVLVERLRVLLQFSFRWMDEDQAVLWYVARDVASGHLREPCFPGQPYGTALEAWFAGPLVWMHVPPNVALPLVSCVLSTVPFLVWAWLARGSFFWSRAILCLPLFLPLDYSVLTSMPRGFAPMLCAATLAFACMQSAKGWTIGVGGLLAVLSYSFNESGLLLVVPTCAWLALVRRRELRFFLWSLSGGLIGAGLHWLSRAFYRWHPSYAMHPPGKFEFFEWLLKDGLAHTGRFFDPVSPGGSFRALVCCALVLVALLIRSLSLEAILPALLWCGLTVVSLGIPKVHDGEDSLYFSVARSFLTVPLGLSFLMFLVATVAPQWLGVARWRGILVLGTVAAAAFVFQMATFNGVIHRIEQTKTWNLGPELVSEVVSKCDAVAQEARQADVTLIVFNDQRELAYACPAFGSGEVRMLFPSYDRRTWLLEEEQATSRERMLIWTKGRASCGPFRKARNCALVGHSGRLVEVTFPPESALDFLRASGGTVRRF
jgi:hypothetical protein